MHNHLAHIQEATETTVAETKKTNEILQASSRQTNDIAIKLTDHVEKSTLVWDGIVRTLVVLEDRTKNSRKTPRTPRRR